MFRIILAAMLFALFAAPVRAAETAAPAPTPPTTVQHATYVVEVNRKGQVTKIRSVAHAEDRRFEAVTTGNVVQVFVRRSDGRAIAGLYRIRYDYDPKTQGVKRTVQLVHAGGVDESAPGLVEVYNEFDRKQIQKMHADVQTEKLRQQLKAQVTASPH